MSTAPPPLKPKMPNGGTPPAPVQSSADRFAITSGRIDGPKRVVIYGPGGIGKSSLARLAPNPVFLDLESGTREFDASRVEGVETFADVRAALLSSPVRAFKTVVIDTVTKLEELAIAHTLATVKTEKGATPTSVEGYGFGKGYQHVFDSFLLALGDLDACVRRGQNVILIAHDCTAKVPNPTGEDFIRYEPHLQAPQSGKASIRNRVVQWSDHVLFVSYDVAAKDGKGIGSGTRTIYPYEMPTHIGKSRTLPAQPLNYESADDGQVWTMIFGGVK